MARKPKAEPEIDNKSKLIEALRFVSFVSTGNDTEDFAYVRIKDKLLIGADNVICMGSPVEENLEICLHGGKFKSALEQCGQNFKLTQVDSSGVSLRSEKFRAVIPIIELDLMAPYLPDAPVAVIDDRIKAGFELCNLIVTGKGDRAYSNSACLSSGAIVSTNGQMALEYWHGIDLPSGLHIPKRALTAITKVKKPLAQFGFSDYSATFYFDDGSFVKTRLEDIQFPNTSKLYDGFRDAPFSAMPSEFFKAIDAISAFTVDDIIYIHDGFVATHNNLELGACFRVEGVYGLHCYSAKAWSVVRDYVKQVYFSNGKIGNAPRGAMFYGDNLRGIIAARSL